MKKIIGFAITLIMICSFSSVVFAASQNQITAANSLYSMGLFNGTGKDANGNPTFELDRSPTRQEAVTMLVGILGKSEEARNGNWYMPFTDVDDWAKPFVGYAYNNGLASGISSTEFGAKQTITATQYLTYVLRYLGYEVGVDFQWDKAWELSDEIGLTDGRYSNPQRRFIRGDVAEISYNALYTDKKGEEFPFPIPEETAKDKEAFEELQKNLKRNNFTDDRIDELTLTWDEARALVGQDIEIVKEYVKTLYDFAYYLAASGHEQGTGDISIEDGDIEWHFNPSPKVVFENRIGNCGGNAGYTAYMLEGDYDEVGLVGMSSERGDGGHVINYIKKGNLYFVMDINQFTDSHGLALRSGTDLNEVVTRATTSGDKKRVVAYTYYGDENGDAPIGWNMREEVDYLIKGYSEGINIVYETNGYVYKEVEVKKSVLDKIIKIKNGK